MEGTVSQEEIWKIQPPATVMRQDTLEIDVRSPFGNAVRPTAKTVVCVWKKIQV